jgi:hypothetical protein
VLQWHHQRGCLSWCWRWLLLLWGHRTSSLKRHREGSSQRLGAIPVTSKAFKINYTATSPVLRDPLWKKKIRILHKEHRVMSYLPPCPYIRSKFLLSQMSAEASIYKYKAQPGAFPVEPFQTQNEQVNWFPIPLGVKYRYVSVRFLLLLQNTWDNQLIWGNIYFG